MMDIDKLEAGCGLDELVAEKVMGYKQDGAGNLLPPEFVGSALSAIAVSGAPSFSTEMWAAWEVVERLVDDGHCPGLIFDDNGHWALPLEGTQNCPMGPGPQDIATSFFIEGDMWAETAPLAICRAALRLYNER